MIFRYSLKAATSGWQYGCHWHCLREENLIEWVQATSHPLAHWHSGREQAKTNQVVDMHIGMTHLLKSTQGINLISEVSPVYFVSGAGIMKSTMERGLWKSMWIIWTIVIWLQMLKFYLVLSWHILYYVKIPTWS